MLLPILYFILLLPAENGRLQLTGILFFFFCILNKRCCSYEQEIKVYVKDKSMVWIMLHSQVR